MSAEQRDTAGPLRDPAAADATPENAPSENASSADTSFGNAPPESVTLDAAAALPDAAASVDPAASAADDPTVPSAQVYEYLMYGLSLPERALRATSAVVGGTLTESAALLVPQAFRSSKSYEVFVQQMLDFMVRDMGRVATADGEPETVEAYVARKAVGSFIDLAGMATLHLSPLTVLAIVSDVAYGSQSYLQELSEELKRAGVIDEDSTIDHAADLLDAIRNASSSTSDALDLPPISVAGLQETLDQTQQAVMGVDPTRLIPQAELQRLWNDIHEMADREGVGILDVSSTMTLYSLDKVARVGQGALSTVTVAGNLFDRHIFDHYRQGLTEIRDNGLYATLAESSRPYTAAVWSNFSTDNETVTEDLFSGRLIGRAWTGVRGWFVSEAGDPPDAADTEVTPAADADADDQSATSGN